MCIPLFQRILDLLLSLNASLIRFAIKFVIGNINFIASFILCSRYLSYRHIMSRIVRYDMKRTSTDKLKVQNFRRGSEL